jgi:hypothetical protein
MSGTLVEDRLHELFVQQAASVRPSLGEWDDVIVDDLAERRDRRRVWAAGVAAAACLVTVVVLGWVATTNDAHGPAAGGRLDLSTEAVQFSADSIVIEAGGQQFSPVGDVDVVSDPNPGAPTLEVTWNEHGVEMRLVLYFSRGIESWKLSEVRVFDGRPQPDWLIPAVPYVLTGTVGLPETGDVDERMVSSDGVPAGRLIIRNFSLLPEPSCPRCVNLPVPGGPVPTIDTAVANVVDMVAPEAKEPRQVGG